MINQMKLDKSVKLSDDELAQIAGGLSGKPRPGASLQRWQWLRAALCGDKWHSDWYKYDCY
jgi:bacteriocin-like protein